MAKIPRERIGEYVQTALRILHENDGQLPSREVTRLVGERLELGPHELETLKSGSTRWAIYLHFYTIDASKAGWLRKKDGMWYLTPEAEEVLDLSPAEFMATASAAYRKWKANQRGQTSGEEMPEETWKEHYPSLADSDSALLPLRSIMFLAPED